MHIGVVAVLDLAGQVGFYIVGVHPGAGHGISGGMADGEPVLDDVFARVDGGNGHLMALGDIFNSGHRCTVHRHSGAFGNGMQGNHNIILGVDLDCKRHTESPYYDKNR